MNFDFVEINENMLKIEDVIDVASGKKSVKLCSDESFKNNIVKGRQALEQLWKNGDVVYGVTTGVGDSCQRKVPIEMSNIFATNLLRFHGCGLGEYFSEYICKAVLLVRLASLKSGFSAVRFDLLERLEEMLQKGIIPRIPSEGSVGASGDLTPLSYIAAVLIGERDVYYKGSVSPAGEVLALNNIKPMELKAKEALAIMNGTSVMTAVSCEAFERSSGLLKIGASLTAMLTEVLGVNKAHFDSRIFKQKPHKGQMEVARIIEEQVNYTSDYCHSPDQRIQATYAIRCAPHIMGVLADSLPWIRQFIETEINSTNDNPLIDPQNGDVLHGGNFYGGHIAFAMDALKTAVANCADLFDRQMALLVNERSNNGLPANLSGAKGASAAINHGFKAVHIATSAFAAEALKLTMPASVFSRSTESHNQDKVSMGTIAARDCIRVLELTEQTLACTLMAAVQGMDLRISEGAMSLKEIHPSVVFMYEKVREICSFVEEDRALEKELRIITKKIRTGDFLTPTLNGSR